MGEPYWKAGAPVVMGMLQDPTDLCDACGIVRDFHRPVNFCPRGGYASGYRRAIGPDIVDTHTQDGTTVNLAQPAPPRWAGTR